MSIEKLNSNIDNDSSDYTHPLTQSETDGAIEFMKNNKVAVFIVAYEAEKHIEKVLNRIPEELAPLFAEIFIIDDSSPDNTFETAKQLKKKVNMDNLMVYRTPYNRGYGGNQKLGYLYAIEKGFDVVILLHGDGQYPPEYLARVINPFNDNSTDAVFASRMLTKEYALKGGMPLYKYYGNQTLTWFENKALDIKLSEFHTGYRAYRTRILKEIPFKYNDNGFHFDTEIIIQIIAKKGGIKEAPIPTHYGDEVCHVNGVEYAFNCIRSVIWYRLTRFGIFYDRKFDVDLFDKGDYTYKQAPNTMHQFIVKKKWGKGKKLLNMFPGSGKLSAEIADKGYDVSVFAEKYKPDFGNARCLKINPETAFDEKIGSHQFDHVLALEGLEHLDDVEDACERIAKILKTGGTLFACAANVVYFPLRLMFLAGAFNYGKRGILDRNHSRLFTKSSFIRMLKNSGFKIKKVRGFGPPVKDMLSNKFYFRMLDGLLSILAKTFPSLFAYQILVEAEKLDDVETILDKTVKSSEK